LFLGLTIAAAQLGKESCAANCFRALARQWFPVLLHYRFISRRCVQIF